MINKLLNNFTSKKFIGFATVVIIGVFKVTDSNLVTLLLTAYGIYAGSNIVEHKVNK
jgi:hypothetical protein